MSESQIIEVPSADWSGHNLSAPREQLLAAVEEGKVLYSPHLRFAIEGGEERLPKPAPAHSKPNTIS
ncbi:3-deoxy-D-manno-oct-2-ulosonic acid (Kdo) hydroxylase, partial [Pseudomonas sp. MWU13-2625]